MKCAEFEVLLSDALDGTIGPADQARLDEHARVCPACAELAADCGGVLTFLARTEAIEPPPALVERVLAHSTVAAAQRPHPETKRVAPAFWRIMSSIQ